LASSLHNKNHSIKERIIRAITINQGAAMNKSKRWNSQTRVTSPSRRYSELALIPIVRKSKKKK
jgi:hypothetical protein